MGGSLLIYPKKSFQPRFYGQQFLENKEKIFTITRQQ